MLSFKSILNKLYSQIGSTPFILFVIVKKFLELGNSTVGLLVGILLFIACFTESNGVITKCNETQA